MAKNTGLTVKAARQLHEQACSGILQIASSLLATLGNHVIGDALALTERAHAGALDGADVHEHVARPIRRQLGGARWAASSPLGALLRPLAHGPTRWRSVAYCRYRHVIGVIKCNEARPQRDHDQPK
jgi:hypothetical protein